MCLHTSGIRYHFPFLKRTLEQLSGLNMLYILRNAMKMTNQARATNFLAPYRITETD